MSRRLLEQINPTTWDSQTPGASGFNRVRYLQSIDDLVNRPLLNRVTASSSGTAINANGAIQSAGIAAGPIQPKRYAEFTVKARVTFSLNAAGPGFVYVYRTQGAIPANGTAPNAGDVIVGGDSFIGGQMTSGVNQSGSFSFLDTGLDVTKQYRYYLAVKGPSGKVISLASGSQLLVMERS